MEKTNQTKNLTAYDLYEAYCIEECANGRDTKSFKKWAVEYQNIDPATGKPWEGYPPHRAMIESGRCT